MAGPSWLADTFAATMLVVAGYCAGRLVISRLWRRETELDGDGIHIVMGVAMAGMLVSRLNPLPTPIWVAGFAGTAAWFCAQAYRAHRGKAVAAWWCPHPVPHLVESAAMLYMFLAVSATRSGGGMAGMGASARGAARFPALGLALALFMIGYVVWTADRITPLTAAGPGIAAAVSAGSATQDAGRRPHCPHRHRRSGHREHPGHRGHGSRARRNGSIRAPRRVRPVPRTALPGLLQDRHGHHHGLHADRHALTGDGSTVRPRRPERCQGIAADADQRGNI